MRAKGMGADVVVTEVDPVRALEAVMDGYRVMPIAAAAAAGAGFVTVTGDIHVIRVEHFKKMKDGAIVGNSGHFNVELDLDGLKKASLRVRTARPFVEEYVLKDGRKWSARRAPGEPGRRRGHPAVVMDTYFASGPSASILVRTARRWRTSVRHSRKSTVGPSVRDAGREDRPATKGAGELSQQPTWVRGGLDFEFRVQESGRSAALVSRGVNGYLSQQYQFEPWASQPVPKGI